MGHGGFAHTRIHALVFMYPPNGRFDSRFMVYVDVKLASLKGVVKKVHITEETKKRINRLIEDYSKEQQDKLNTL